MEEDHRSYIRNLCSCEKKAWKKKKKKKSGLYEIRTFDLCDTGAALYQQANLFVINSWKDDDEIMNIWKSYILNI